MTVKKERIAFEDALDMTGFGKFNYGLILLISIVITGMGFEIFSVAYVVPASACELETSSVQQGLMASVPLVGIILMSHIWGYLADTKGRRKMLLISLILGFSAGALATFSTNWIVLSVLKLASSGAVAGTLALALTLLSECTPESKRFALVISTTTVYLIATGSMAVITIPILPLEFSYYVPVLNIHFNSWRLLNLIYTIPCAIGAISLIWAYESPKYLLSVGKEEQALDVLKKMYALNSGKDKDEFKVDVIYLDEDKGTAVKGLWNSMVTQTIPLLRQPLLRNTIILAFLYLTVYICINPFMVWLPYMADGFMRSLDKGDRGMTFCEMLRSSQNATIDQPADCSLDKFAMTMVFAINMLLAILNILITSIMSCVGRKSLLVGVQIIAGIAALSINFSNVWILSAILLITFIFGVLNFGLLTTFVVDIFPTYVKAMAVCLTLMIGRGSAVLGINLLKELLEKNCESSFYIFGSITILGGLVGLLLPGEKKKAQRKCPET